MSYFVFGLPFLPLLVLLTWASSSSLTRRLPVRAKGPLAGVPVVFLMVSALGFAVVGLFGLREGGDYAARALMLDRSTVQALAWGPALLAYLSFVVGVGLLMVSLRAHHDA